MRILTALPILVALASGYSFAELEAQQYEAQYVHRYMNEHGAVSWEVSGLSKVGPGFDGNDAAFPNEQAFFVTLTDDRKAHVFFHGKAQNGFTWLTAAKVFEIEPQHIEAIELQDHSKLYVTFKPSE